MREKIDKLREEFNSSILSIKDEKDYESIYFRFLGRKGEIAELFKKMPEVPQEERASVGSIINEFKKFCEGKLEKTHQKLLQEKKELEKKTSLDVTLPGTLPSLGRRHPITQMVSEIERIFSMMGFTVLHSPEIETDYYNFEALNIPADHPARDEQDSFYLNSSYLLRTHTSPGQIRVMKKKKPPLRVIIPGRCFRRDAVDVSHLHTFYQVEGLMVDKRITFSHLKGVLEVFAREIFGTQATMRFRPDYFPFTEPSAELAISCFPCRGRGCRTCSETGWLEIGGAGMVHPRVFKGVGYNYEAFTGFAFGLGIDRLIMNRYGINDIRILYENDLRFLRQF